MERFWTILLQFIKKMKGTDDIMSLDYNEITEDMDQKSFDIQKTIGNVNLIQGRFKTPKAAKKEVDTFLQSALP